MQYKVIGVMSGTSMDGVDLAYCIFNDENNKWSYEIAQAETIAYDKKWITRLTQLHTQPAFVYPKTDAFYGKYLGTLIQQFTRKHNLDVDFIASHGHTIFHQPENGFTAQIGSGAAIYAETGIPVINDFRAVDVALGGQGAPLVPIGDELLFANYDACLNLGGFSNISYSENGKRVAFDISPCNIIMNKVANRLDAPYDVDGKIAASGTTNEELLNSLNQLPYYSLNDSKSLGAEWVDREFWPLVKFYNITVADLMATFNHHIALQIAKVITGKKISSLLTTGGGAFNKTLLHHITRFSGILPSLPDPRIINYKEALIFAFLGVLRMERKYNSLRSVTGAVRDNIGGSIWG